MRRNNLAEASSAAEGVVALHRTHRIVRA